LHNRDRHHHRRRRAPHLDRRHDQQRHVLPPDRELVQPQVLEQRHVEEWAARGEVRIRVVEPIRPAIWAEDRARARELLDAAEQEIGRLEQGWPKGRPAAARSTRLVDSASQVRSDHGWPSLASRA
jgi:hypothetical protein